MIDVIGLMEKLFPDAQFSFYGQILVREKGGERQLTIYQAVEEALQGLPWTKGREDSQARNRMETALRGRFIQGEQPRPFISIGRDLNVNRERARQLEAKALRLLRSWREGLLRNFVIPSPEEIAEFRSEIERLQKENEAFQQKIEILHREREEIGEWAGRLGIPLFLPLDLFEAQEMFRVFLNGLPTLYRNGLVRVGIRSLPQLQRMLEKGEKIRRVGEKGEIFLAEALERFLSQEEQKASSQ